MTFTANRFTHLLLDVLLIVGLAAYTLAGIPLASFHGDEGMHIYSVLDYFTAFVDRNPAELMTSPPYPIDSRQHLRLLNGSFQRYAAGFALAITGHTPADMTAAPGWNWGLSYADNVAGGWLPHQDVLIVARWASALTFLGSIGAMFGIGMAIGGRGIAYPATLLYALHPIILLNVRRSMMEGSLLTFGLLTLWVGVWIAKQVYTGNVRWWAWGLLALCGGFALASKHTGAIFLVGAWGWVAIALLATLRQRGWGVTLRQLTLLGISGVVALALFVALSPALWNAPFARFGDLLAARTELLEVQVLVSPDAPTTLSYRLWTLVREPFIATPSHFEVVSWGEAAPIVAQIQAYQASGWAGLQAGYWLGTPLTLLALWGAVLIFTRRSDYRLPLYGLAFWLVVTSGALLATPLPWQRYVIPYLPITCLLAALGIHHTVGLVYKFAQRTRLQSSAHMG